MNKSKRKNQDVDIIISESLAKKNKTSYADECDTNDSNALIINTKKKEPAKKKTIPVEPILSKKQRKLLEKKVKVKEVKSKISDLYAELEAFNNLKPEKALESLKNDVKSNLTLSRKNLSEKVKPVSNRKLKSWEKQKDQKNLKESTKIDSPNTSDFSSDDEDEEEEQNNETEEKKEGLPIIEKNEEQYVEEIPVKETKSETVQENQTTQSLDSQQPKPAPLKPRPASYVLVDRPEHVQQARMELPILAEEATIMEAISENDVVILSGATGCGKTTQVPQFLYEAGYTKNGLKIGITEPRRVAAMSMSKRVAHELNCENTNLVSYHIRYDKNSTCSTQIKFMTDGVLLQEIKQDVLLQSYSAILIDEAHERSVYSDMLIGLLSIIVRARRRDYNLLETASTSATTTATTKSPLKLIIMSATMRVSDFADNRRLFPGLTKPPVLELPTRQHPVQIKFSRQTKPKYLEEAFKKVVEVHEKSPEGGILVFVTGQQEVLTMCKWLRNAFPVTEKFLQNKGSTVPKHAHGKSVTKAVSKDEEMIKVNLTDFSIIPLDEESELGHVVKTTDDDEIADQEAVDHDGENDEEFRDDIQNIISGVYSNISLEAPIHALPLYSLLPAEKQNLVFQPPPPGHRLVVVSTNVAETSITIPSIKYVIDTGMEKVKRWDPITGVSRFELGLISQSSAEQRAGRAGRVGPGFCYRLFSSAVFQSMRSFSEPEIVQRPIEDVVLMLRNYIHSSIPIHRFCLPTVPSETAIAKAERNLVSMGALRHIKNSIEAKRNNSEGNMTELTELGRTMCQIPLNPRFSRMLLLANQHGLLPYGVLMVSVLSVPNFFTLNRHGVHDYDDGNGDDMNKLHWEFKRRFVQKRPDLLFGDISVLLGAQCMLEKVFGELAGDESQVRRIAETHGVRWQAFMEVRKLRKQLSDILNSNIKNLDLIIDPFLPRPNATQFEHLRQLVLSGSQPNVARFVPVDLSVNQKNKRDRGMYKSCTIDRPVFIHPDSVLYREKYEWLIFQDLYSSASGNSESDKTAKLFMRNVTVIEPQWLPIFCTLECRVEGLVLNPPLINSQSAGANNTEQPPSYDSNHDCIMASAKKIFYGHQNLLLPAGTRIPLVRGILEDESVQLNKVYRWFAKFFLEGAVFTEMVAWRSKFKSSLNPDLILNPIGYHRPEIRSLVSEISELEMPSRRALCTKWKENKNYLLNSYLQWISPDEIESITAVWPPSESK